MRPTLLGVALLLGCGSVNEGGDADGDSDSDSDTGSDTGSDSDYCAPHAAHRVTCGETYAESEASCRCSECALRPAFAEAYFACVTEVPCDDTDGLTACFEVALRESPPGTQATEYDTTCTARATECATGDAWGDDPNLFTCGGSLGATEELAEAVLGCFGQPCVQIRACRDGAEQAICPACG